MWNWKFRELLKREGVSVYRLHRALGDTDSDDTLYRWARRRPVLFDLRRAERILLALSRLTGKRYRLSDLVEFETG